MRDNVPEERPWYLKPNWNCDYDLQTFMENYYGEITHFDAAFGRIVNKIEELNLAKNTIVIFTSDHGEMLGSHGRYSKGIMHEEAVHISLIIRHPVGKKGRTDALFSSVDFLPTLLELCNLPITDTAEGCSYAPLIKGEEQKKRQAVFVDYKGKCIISDNYKLITDKSGKEVNALYHTKEDPFELKNLVDNIQFKGVKNQLHQRLITWEKDIR